MVTWHRLVVRADHRVHRSARQASLHKDKGPGGGCPTGPSRVKRAGRAVSRSHGAGP